MPAVDENKYKDMVSEQLEKLKAEREERARVGATTPPMPASPSGEYFQKITPSINWLLC